MALAHAILALLTDRTYSGYDLAKDFDGGPVGYFWQATRQQIYRELGRMEAQGLVRSETIPKEGGLDKKLYTVTELGQQQLIEWIAQPSEPTQVREDLLVKIRAGYLVPRQTTVKELERRRQIHLEKLSVLQDKERQLLQKHQELSPEEKLLYLNLVIRRGIRYEADWIAWCDEAIQLLS